MKTTRLIIPLTALAVAVLMAWPDRQSYIPERLRGIWKTDHARYADRYLDISEAIFTIGQGGRQLQVFFVQRVDTAAEGPREAFTLHYRETFDSGIPVQTLTLFLIQTDAGLRLRLNHRNDIQWYRENHWPDAAASWEAAGP